MTNEMFSKMCRYPHSYWNNRLCPDAWRIISSEMMSSSHLRTFILYRVSAASEDREIFMEVDSFTCGAGSLLSSM